MTVLMNDIKHIGLILDGNRRYGEKSYSNKLLGHNDGYEKLKEVLSWCKEAGIKEASAYVFSFDNWNREEKEVNALLDLFEKALDSDYFLKNKDIKIRFIGNLDVLKNKTLLDKIKKVEDQTSNSEESILNVLFSYSGTEDIKNLKLTGELLSTKVSPVDLVIRTGGTRRLSDFLPLQSAYAELYFLECLWPEINKDEFNTIVEDYKNIKINKGK